MRTHTQTHNYLPMYVITEEFLFKFTSQKMTAGPTLNKNQTTGPHHIVTLRTTFEIRNNTVVTWLCFIAANLENKSALCERKKQFLRFPKSKYLPKEKR